jgi:FkbM family methyltransferase
MKKLLRRFRRDWNVLLGRGPRVGNRVRLNHEYLGNETASWAILRGSLTPRSVVYSFGVGRDISFDLAVIERYGAQVHAFDPTPRAAEWMDRQETPPQLVFHRIGIANYDGTARFSPPTRPTDVSYSLKTATTSDGVVEAPVARLATLMTSLGHAHLDLLKMDIEGAEFDVLNDILKQDLEVTQIALEFHHFFPNISPRETEMAIRQLRDHGYALFAVSDTGVNYSFVKINC